MNNKNASGGTRDARTTKDVRKYLNETADNDKKKIITEKDKNFFKELGIDLDSDKQ